MKSNFGNELDRIYNGPRENDAPHGIGSVRFYATCNHNADEVLSTVRKVMREIAMQSVEGWDDNDDWSGHFPECFMGKFTEELSEEEAHAWLSRWRRMGKEEREREEQNAWALSDWLYWMSPDNRSWFWWDAKVASPDIIVLAVSVDEWPFPWGLWLGCLRHQVHKIFLLNHELTICTAADFRIRIA